jgi:hypothetical protein
MAAPAQATAAVENWRVIALMRTGPGRLSRDRPEFVEVLDDECRHAGHVRSEAFASTAGPLMPATSTVLFRAVAPLTIRIERRGTSSTRARVSTTASFAASSTGGAVTRHEQSAVAHAVDFRARRSRNHP